VAVAVVAGAFARAVTAEVAAEAESDSVALASGVEDAGLAALIKLATPATALGSAVGVLAACEGSVNVFVEDAPVDVESFDVAGAAVGFG